MKIDATIKKETLSIGLGVICLSLIMEAVYLLVGYWHVYILLANFIGATVSVVNFLLMGISVQKAMNEEASDAKIRMKVSQNMRSLLVFVIICAAASLTTFGIVPERYTIAYIIALLLPILFNRIVILVKSLMMNKAE